MHTYNNWAPFRGSGEQGKMQEETREIWVSFRYLYILACWMLIFTLSLHNAMKLGWRINFPSRDNDWWFMYFTLHSKRAFSDTIEGVALEKISWEQAQLSSHFSTVSTCPFCYNFDPPSSHCSPPPFAASLLHTVLTSQLTKGVVSGERCCLKFRQFVLVCTALPSTYIIDFIYFKMVAHSPLLTHKTQRT